MEWAQILIPVTVSILISGISWFVESRASKKRDEERKKDINSAKKRIAALQKQANMLEEQTEMQRSIFNKPPFSEVMWFPKMRYRITVDGSRSVYVESLKCIDDNYFFQPDTQLPQTFKPSEPIDYLANGSPNVEITWRWADMPEMPMETIRRRGIKPSM